MKTLEFLTRGNNDIVNITASVEDAIKEHSADHGVVTVFLPSTTAAIVIMEDEEGAIADLLTTLERIVPSDGNYQHNAKWGDHNAYAQVRGALFGPSVSVPFARGELLLGSWQSILLIDFDTQPRTRTIHIAIE